MTSPRINAAFTFTGYDISDTGITFNMVCFDPGPGLPTDWPVFCTDAELAPLTTAAQLRDLIVAKLQRKYRALGIATKLDPLIGSVVNA